MSRAGEDGKATAAVAEVRAALESEGDLTALDVLEPVLRWTADTLCDDGLRSPAAAFHAVAKADRAFAAAPALFAALTVLIEQGEPAEQVAADLSRYREQLASLERQTAPLRDRLEALQEAEARLRADAHARDQITARIAELGRIERLAAAVPELRAQRDVLEERVRRIAAITVSAETELAAAGERLVTVTAELMDGLDENTRGILLRAKEQDRVLGTRLAERRSAIERAAEETARLNAELAQAAAQAAEAQQRFEHARTVAATRLAALRRYAASDRAVADALITLPGQVMTALKEIEIRLADVDGLLSAALAAGERVREEAVGALRTPPPSAEED